MRNLLRPSNFQEFIGQKKLKKTFKIIIQSAKKRKATIDHILLHGNPGTGKTSLATIIAKQLQARIRYAQGPTLDKKADILSLFSTLFDGDIIFIDEIHSINKNIEELIYSALEDGVLDFIIGPEGNSKIVRMKLPKFTLIGATTKLEKISMPLRERFGILGKLLPYEEKEVIKIIKQSSNILKWKIKETALILISSYSRAIPRIANNLLKRVIDFAVVKNLLQIDEKIVKTTFKYLGLYEYGLTEQHIEYLKCLNEVFNNKFASLDSIIRIIKESKQSIKIDIEPILIVKKLIIKSSRGRSITKIGKEYIASYK